AGGVCVVGVQQPAALRGPLTTGWVRNTLLDSLLMEAAITWELTTSRFLSWFSPSTSIFTVAFSVDRKEPRFLYRMKTTLTCPARGGETQND
uniref:Uncharacterized protein n=1 Tax=Salarias fasciatus TaxID=181472 RepID=A0A672IA02_SALFA